MDKMALIDLILNHWQEFVSLCDNEDIAKEILLNLQKEIAGWVDPDLFY